MEISLVIKASNEEDIFITTGSEKKNLAKEVRDVTDMLRIAGGSILPIKTKRKNNEPSLTIMASDSEDEKKEAKKILRSLLPGFVLILRNDLLSKRLKELQSDNSEATSLDALLEFSSINHECKRDEDNAEKFEWIITRKNPGWIVPISIGFRAISELYESGGVQNARDMNYPFAFVESIYSLGQWISPHRLSDINDIFWFYNYDAGKCLYLCKNTPKTFISTLNEEIDHDR